MSAVLVSDPYQLRFMTADDLDEVMAIETQAYPFPWTLGIFRDCLRVGYSCRVLERDGHIEAYSVMSFGAQEAHILNLCVRTESRRQGLGKTMLSILVEDAKILGADTILLEVRPTNIAAVTLYEENGFIEIGLRKNYYPAQNGREDAVIYAKSID